MKKSFWFAAALTVCAALSVWLHLQPVRWIAVSPPGSAQRLVLDLMRLPPLGDLALLAGAAFLLRDAYRGGRALRRGIVLVLDAVALCLCLALHLGLSALWV